MVGHTGRGRAGQGCGTVVGQRGSEVGRCQKGGQRGGQRGSTGRSGQGSGKGGTRG